MTLDEWQRWLDHAKPGSEIVYACAGTLGDKHLTPDTLAVAEAAKVGFSKGLIELVQRRVTPEGKKPGAFEYLAIKKRTVRVPLANGVPWEPKIMGPWRIPGGRASRNDRG